MYGRSANSIAEVMGVSVEEAQGIINDFYNGFPKVKEFVQFAQEHARDYGYVETAWGRKRRLTDMQLDPIEVTYDVNASSALFNPLDFTGAGETLEGDAPDEVYYKYLNLMNRAFGRKKKEAVKEMAKAEGFLIKDNGGKIEDAKRQCVNSIIQGSAADMTKIAMISIHNDKELNELGFKLAIPVHDEVLGVCPIENAKAVRDRLTYLMVHVVDGKFEMPMKTDVEVSLRWYSKSLNDEELDELCKKNGEI